MRMQNTALRFAAYDKPSDPSYSKLNPYRNTLTHKRIHVDDMAIIGEQTFPKGPLQLHPVKITAVEGHQGRVVNGIQVKDVKPIGRDPWPNDYVSYIGYTSLLDGSTGELLIGSYKNTEDREFSLTDLTETGQAACTTSFCPDRVVRRINVYAFDEGFTSMVEKHNELAQAIEEQTTLIDFVKSLFKQIRIQVTSPVPKT